MTSEFCVNNKHIVRRFRRRRRHTKRELKRENKTTPNLKRNKRIIILHHPLSSIENQQPINYSPRCKSHRSNRRYLPSALKRFGSIPVS